MEGCCSEIGLDVVFGEILLVFDDGSVVCFGFVFCCVESVCVGIFEIDEIISGMIG